jgi:UDP-sugar transporter A1/2/3
MQLAFFSILFALCGMAAKDGLRIQFFRGYDHMTGSLIMIQALGGLIVAVVVKYADNILKGFAAAFSIVVCGIASMYLFGFVPSVLFVMGGAVVMASTFLYSMPDPKPAQVAAAGGVSASSMAIAKSLEDVFPTKR